MAIRRPTEASGADGSVIEDTRIARLNDRLPASNGKYVLYWMQQSQRAEHNDALEYAVQRANERKEPVVVAFGLTDRYPHANLRHYRFMLEGLRETQATLRARGIRMLVRRGEPAEVALELARDASVVVCDRGYLRHQVRWRTTVAERARCEVVRVESDAIVPVEVASNKAEYMARTLRPKVHRYVDEYLRRLRPAELERESTKLRAESIDLSDPDAILAKLSLDRSVAPSPFFHGGISYARAILDRFVRRGLAHYAEERNQPQTDNVSYMGMYLHFGQISPIEVALRVKDDTYREELVVRRELALNFVTFAPDYDTYRCLPRWAQATLHAHRKDRRDPLYSKAQLDAASTHDRYWNAAMWEMKATGYMHNYMRMYWGKKILEWSATPQEAFATVIDLNDRYFLDGRDPNSYANVAWVFGLHDRPWPERPIYGTVRSMSAAGLERKCAPDEYVEKVRRRSSSVATHGVRDS